MHAAANTRIRRAMTMIELLAALVILSLAASVSIGVAGPLSEGQRRAAAIDAVNRALSRARLLAETHGGAQLTIDDHGFTARAAQGGSETLARDVRVTLPVGFDGHFETDGATTDSLRFDARGRCEDAIVILQRGGHTAVRIELLGISGQTRVLAAAAEDAR